MKRLLVLFSCLYFSFALQAQDKVQWTIVYNKQTNSVQLKASIQPDWHLYSQHLSTNEGPVPTTFVFDEKSGLLWSSDVKEPTSLSAFDPNFEATLNYFEKEVVFERTIKGTYSGVISGTITYMVCNDEMCLPPVEVPFSIQIKTP